MSSVAVQNLETGERTVLVEGANDAQFVATGHVIYLVGWTMFAVAFDATRLKSPHTASPIVEGIWRSGTNGVGQFAVSPSGTLEYVPGSSDTTTDRKEIAVIDRSGHRVGQRGVHVGSRSGRFGNSYHLHCCRANRESRLDRSRPGGPCAVGRHELYTAASGRDQPALRRSLSRPAWSSLTLAAARRFPKAQ